MTLARSGTDLRVRVADTGRGIDPEELPHIFDAFYQGANNTEHVGTGVGLALVKQIVTSMHGEIEVSSQLGQGTVFTILQPLRQAGHKNMQPLDTTAPLPAEPAHPLLEESDIVLPQGLANADDNSRTAPLVLIVEDDRDVAYYIGAQLQQRYSLRYASDGNEGLVLAQELMPDLVIGRVLDGVAQQVVHHLAHVVGHKVHLDVVLFGGKLDVDVLGLGPLLVGGHEHARKGHDVAAAPVGVAYRRLHLGDVEQLVDEREQALYFWFLSLPRT